MATPRLDEGVSASRPGVPARALMADRQEADDGIKSCRSCGERYSGPVHNCGYVTIRKDRLRELVAIEPRGRGRGRSAAREFVPGP
jgi:hypothetical protein